MFNKDLYKYINLPVKVTVGIGALIFIYLKVKDDLIYQFKYIDATNIGYLELLLVVLLMFLNWGIEAYKWKYAVRTSEHVSFLKALKYTFMGVTAGILTPNRVAEIPVRALLLNKTKFKELTAKTLLAGYSQVLTTLFFGIISFYGLGHFIALPINSTLFLILLIVIAASLFYAYFNPRILSNLFRRIPFINNIIVTLTDVNPIDRVNLFVLSVLRYLVFTLQYFLILSAFEIQLHGIKALMLIPLCFMFTSLIPTVLLSEIGVRGSVAILVFGLVSHDNTQIVAASIMLWFINVAVPALFGLFYVRQLNLIQQP